jgi:copper resistance protein C
MTVRISRIAVFAAAVVIVGLSTLALAHTKLEKSEPAAGATLTEKPRQVQLWFNEKIDPVVSKIELTSASGKIALSGMHVMGGKELMASVSGDTPNGTYTVAWQTAGDDGHVTKGDFTFAVKTAH